MAARVALKVYTAASGGASQPLACFQHLLLSLFLQKGCLRIVLLMCAEWLQVPNESRGVKR